jgi:tRNA A-37 threonylcarbamoyl transferase component Bud32
MNEGHIFPASNDVRLVMINGAPHILKRHLPKPKTFHYYKYNALSAFGIEIPVEHDSVAARCDYEFSILRHWHALGYKVPRAVERVDSKSLLIEFIEGETMLSIMNDPARSEAYKLELIEKVMAETLKRSEGATDHRLVHFDSNLRNIILSADNLYHIDFESGRTSEPVSRSFAREVDKFCFEAIRTIGSDAGTKVVSMASSMFRRTQVGDYLRRLFAYT